MTTRRLVNLDDFVTEKTTYNRFGEKVTKTPLVRIADGGLLSNYKQLSTNAKYIKFTGMLEPNDGGEGMYIQDDTITDDEDLGVIIYIGEHKYRRLYAAWVNIDWFYIDDFGVALQRAIKYSSIRGTRGKTYECKSAITAHIDIRNIGNHGMVDLGHKLIDMRNATVNFTNEEEKYCFNIRIYHRDTKFMFTNCNFNVTSNNINLVNIANIIGVNSYTDMLTDNVYNVTKDKLPDTNRVVLVDEPEIEGIKTFDSIGQLQYIGDAISADDNQAVTKEYMPADYDESLYVSLQDTRKLDGLTTFTNIFDRDQGNTVLQGKINDYILESIQTRLEGIVVTNAVTVWLPKCYILYTINNAILQNYLNYGILIYKLYADKLDIFLQTQHIVDESELLEPLFTKVMINESIKFKPDIIEEQVNISTKDRTGISILMPVNLQNNVIIDISIANLPITIQDTIYTVTKGVIIFDNKANLLTHPRQTISADVVVGIYIEDKLYILSCYTPKLYYYSVLKVRAYNKQVQACINLIPVFSSNTFNIVYNNISYKCVIAAEFFPKNYRWYDWYETAQTRCPATVFGTSNNLQVAAKPNIYYGDYITYVKPSSRPNSFYIPNIKTYTGQIPCVQVNTTALFTTTDTVKRVTNLPMEILSITGQNEYIQLTSIKIYLTPDTTIDSDGYVTIDTFYIACLQAIQGNLAPNPIAPTATIIIHFIYNDAIIISSPVSIYNVRFMSMGIPRNELPVIYRANILTAGDNIRYPLFHVFSNNSILPKTLDILPMSNYLDPAMYYANVNRNVSCNRKSGTCKCPCQDLSGTITRDPNGRSTVGTYKYDGKSYTPVNVWNYNTYISNCNEGETNRTFSYSTGGTQIGNRIITSTYQGITDSGSPNLVLFNIAFNNRVFTINPGEVVILHLFCYAPLNISLYSQAQSYYNIGVRSNAPACAAGSAGVYLTGTAVTCTPYFMSVLYGITKNKLFDRLFGQKALSNVNIYRDGILKDPFRYRTQLPEHQFAPPVGVLNP